MGMEKGRGSVINFWPWDRRIASELRAQPQCASGSPGEGGLRWIDRGSVADKVAMGVFGGAVARDVSAAGGEGDLVAEVPSFRGADGLVSSAAFDVCGGDDGCPSGAEGSPLAG